MAAGHNLSRDVLNKFCIEEGMDIEDWLTEYEEMGRARSFDDTTLKELLISNLKGSAHRWAINRTQFPTERNERDYKLLGVVAIPWRELTWQEVKDVFLKRYLSADKLTHLEQRFKAKQRGNEKVVAFVDEREYYGRKLNKTEAQIIETITNGLLPHLRDHIVSQDFFYLSEFLDKLKKLEVYEAEKKRSRRPEPTYTRPAPMRGGGDQREPPRTRMCYNCRKPGHIARDCREPRVFNNTNNPPRFNDGKRNSLPQRSYNNSNGNRTNRAVRAIEANYDGMESAEYTNFEINKVEGRAYIPTYNFCCTIEGKPMKVTFDNGADTTVMDYNFFKENFDHLTLHSPERDGATGAGGDPMRVMGWAYLRYGYYVDAEDKDYEVTITTLVVDHLRATLLLGRDFIYRAGVSINPRTYTVTCEPPVDFPGESKPMLLKSQKQGPPGPEAKIMMVQLESQYKDYSGRQPIFYRIEEEGNEDYSAPPGAFGQSLVEQLEKDPIMRADDLTEEDVPQFTLEEEIESLELLEGSLKIGKDITQTERKSLAAILNKRKSVFAFNGELGRCNVIKHDIDTGNSPPVHVVPYRQSERVREAIDKQFDEWYKAGIVRPSLSPWASPCVVVPKKDGTLRMCVDLRRVNSLTVRDIYPMPHIDDLLTYFSGKQYFSTIDLNQGYMQIELTSRAIPKTAVVTQSSKWEFVRMPFGLVNAPSTFQRTMDIILADLKYKQCLVYLDDIIVFGQSWEEHNHNLEQVLIRLKKANLTAKPSKCIFGVKQIHFLGHVIGQDGIRMDPKKVSAIYDLPQPQNVRDVQSFLGAASYYRKFVKDFAKIAEPLSRLTRKDLEFVWEAEQANAYNELKDRLCQLPVLCHYDTNTPIELRTDACGYGLGAILLHDFNGEKRVIAYASRLMSKAEKNYGITEKEGLAVVWAIKKFGHYLQGVKFTVVTDHQALMWLQTKKDLTGRLMRWALILQTYDFKVVYKSGKIHKDVDHLSRNPIQVNAISYGRRGTVRVDTNTHDEDYEEVSEQGSFQTANYGEETLYLDEDRIKREQKEDTFCKKCREAKNGRYTTLRGLLVEKNGRFMRIVLPRCLFTQAMYTLHDDPTSAHGGYRKTLWRFNQRYVMKGAPKLIKTYVQSCHFCQTKKMPWTRKLGMLQPIPPPNLPFERIGIDTVGPFRVSGAQNKKIIVVTDHMSKWVVAKAVKQDTAKDLATFLIEEVFFRYGMPRVILSDKNKTYSTQLMQEIYREFETRHISTTAYHPQTNGLTERFNRTLANMLSMYVSQNHRDWDVWLKYVVFAYNTTVQDSTGYAPFYLLHGFQARLPTEILYQDDNTPPTKRYEKLHEARELAIKANISAQARQKHQYDKKQYSIEFNVGDQVLVLQQRGYTGQTTKLRHPYRGPFKVIAKYSDLVYLVDWDDGSNRKGEELVHVSRMKPYFSREIDTDGRDDHSTTGAISIRKIWLWLFSILCILDRVESKVLWRRRDFPITKGIQDVLLYVHYKTPCDDDQNLFSDPRFSARANVSRKFDYWCQDYTHKVLHEKLGKFCDDDGTIALSAKRRKASYKKYRVLARTSGLERRKRVAWLVAMAGVALGAVVYWVGEKVYDWATSTTTSSNIEDVARNNMENTIKLVTENDEISKRINGIYNMINTTSHSVYDLQEQLLHLKMEASMENQALVSAAITLIHLTAHDLEEVAELWREHKVSDKLPKLFGYRDPCLTGGCPTKYHTPKNCRLDATRQKVTMRLSRRMIDETVAIVHADPFSYFKILDRNGTTLTNSTFWSKPPLEKLNVCKSTYNGPKAFAVDKQGCMKVVKPDDPSIDEVPIILDGCVKNPTETTSKDDLYGDWHCSTMDSIQFDFQSVQVKSDKDKERVYVYCPYQQIVINNLTAPRDCPIFETLDLPIATNFTVYRHPDRGIRESIVTYHHHMVISNTTTTFQIPEVFRKITPSDDSKTGVKEELAALKLRLNEALSSNQRRQEGLRWKFTKFVGENKTAWWKRAFVGIGLIIGTIILLMVSIGVCLSWKEREEPKEKQDHPISPQKEPGILRKETPSTTESEDDSRVEREHARKKRVRVVVK